jgi:DNA-binding CsgD family transcriptional regulator/tetratricopeptide (TPR) repeat protein
VVEVLCPVVVGRAAPLASLRAALSGAVDGTATLVFVTGEAGVGKSRLSREITAEARAQGVHVVTGRAVPASASTPFRPLTEALLQLLRDRDVSGDARLSPWLLPLAAIVPTPFGTSAAGAGESLMMLAEAVLRLLRRHAEPAGLVLVLEDLHWADPDTLSLVEYLGDNLSSERVVCIATTRDEAQSPAIDLARRMHGRRAASVIELTRLTDGDVAEMTRVCVPEADSELIERVRRTADGVPFLVEEVLASPGVPASFADTVRERLADVDHDERRVLEAAAVLGRHFDWRLLESVTGLPMRVVGHALERGVDSLLLSADEGSFRFRHALTREALLRDLLPHRHAAIAQRALEAVDTAHPALTGGWRDVAADLAARAGDRSRAGVLLAASGRDSLHRGGLATAIDNLRRAVDLLGPGPDRVTAGTTLVEALALAGRVDEAMSVGEELIGQLSDSGSEPVARSEIHVRLAQAAVAAARWASATEHLDAAEALTSSAERAALGSSVALLRAEVDLGVDDLDAARHHAELVLTAPHAGPDSHCHAWELIGRSHRVHDLQAAREAFERALSIADAAHLRIARVRALHELGTIEMFDRVGVTRLTEARRLAADIGALSMVAMLDMHLAAAYILRFETAEAERHARSSVATAERLGLDRVHAIALIFAAQTKAMQRDPVEMERLFALAMAVDGSPFIEGSGWAGGRGMGALLAGDDGTAMYALERGESILRPLRNPGPANYRGLWALLLAAADDRRSGEAIENAYRSGMAVNRGNRGFLQYAEAVHAGRRGDADHAAELARRGESDLANHSVWGALALLQASRAALADGWGEPTRWLTAAGDAFTKHGFDTLAERCRTLLGRPGTAGLNRFGVTARESEVLRLVAEGRSNKEIAAVLYLSPRTVEKHVESLLRKTGARSRTALVALAGNAG